MFQDLPLSQTFQESAMDLCRNFPGRLDKLVVLVDTSETPVYVSSDIADRLSGNTGAVREALDEGFYGMPHADGYATRDYSMAGSCVDLIALREEPLGIYSPLYTKRMLTISVFDHEMGHLVVKNGTSFSEHLAECAADAYAALRHIQRFGRETDFFEFYDRSYTIVLGLSAAHYTDSVIQRVKQISEERDISSLSLQKTADLANEIALQYQINDVKLGKIANAFSPVATACERLGDLGVIKSKLNHEGDEAWPMFFRGVLSVIKNYQDDPDIFEAGKRFLSHPARKKFMEKLAKKDPYWQEALDLIGQPAFPRPQNAVAINAIP